MDILTQLRELSAAEEFFALLEVPYDPARVNVARLHILRRMGQYLANEDFAGIEDVEIRRVCAGHLAQAYEDFIRSAPIDQRVFKVLKEAVAPKKVPQKPFVPLTALTARSAL
jgi:nitrogenase-stabilizing/protective protein